MDFCLIYFLLIYLYIYSYLLNTFLKVKNLMKNNYSFKSMQMDCKNSVLNETL